MKFGTFNYHAMPPDTNPYEVVHNGFQQALQAERAGFYEVWLPEHNGRPYGMVGNTAVTAAAIAAATSKIRIGTAVTRLPLHHPVHLAEDLAYVDVLSRGRIDWGIGKGYDPLEFASYGIPFEDREERWEETFEAVRHIWSTRRTEFKGELFNFADSELLPYPLQRPSLPTYVMVSKSDPSVLWAANRLLPMAIGSGPDWDDVKRKMDLYAETASAAGFEDSAIRETLQHCWQLKQIHVADTTEQAIEEYRDALMWYFEALGNRAMFGFSKETQPYEYFMRHPNVLVGSTEKVGDAIQRYRDHTGVQNIICFINIGGQPHLQVLNAIDRFGEELIPRFS
jgi:alkanesulfonate monooxygenase SsuD/methylene tetrahydromethanopterin reductase-like flavin-dependent oxidoreductase (luciferase family)